MIRRLAVLLLTPPLLLAACSGDGSRQTAATPQVAHKVANLSAAVGTVSLTASSQAPAGGASVDFVAKAPVISDPALISQTVEGQWDSHFALSAAPTIPEGWTATYYAGQSLITTPSTPSGWATVTRVVATGNYQSDGTDLNGNQIVLGNTSAAAPPAATSFSGGSAGDGWNVFFSPDRTRVYNIHHHDSPATVMCRLAANGNTCSAGWPFNLYHTSYRSTGWVDPTNLHLWHETIDNSNHGGWECIDTSGATPVNCSTRFVTSFTGNNNNIHGVMDLQNVGRELYSLDLINGRLMCLDLDGNNGAGAPCAGQPYTGFGGTDFYYTSIRAINGKIYVQGGSQIKCFDPQTKAACAGMQWPKPTTEYQPVFPVPSANGVVQNLCTNGTCYALDGGTSTVPAAFSTYITNNHPTGCCSEVFNGIDYAATKVFWPNGYAVRCFDMATNAACTGFPISVNAPYVAVSDPANSNCLWTNGDDGVIRTWNIPNGAAGCTSPPTLSSFKAALAVPRLACSGGAPRVTSWSQFTLTNPPPSGYTSATLTVKDSVGAAITNWIAVPLNGDQPLDISGLTTLMTGQAPTFEVNYLNLTNFTAPTASFRVVGQSPEVCWSATAQTACPSGGGLLPDPLPATSATTVTGSGTLTLTGQNAVSFTPTTVDITAPNQTDPTVCGGGLGGTLLNAANAPVKDARVELLNASSQPILDGNSAPIVAISGVDGTYTFPPLLTGTYRVRLSTVPDYWTISTASVTIGGTGTTTAASGVVVSNLITITGGLTANVNGSFVGPIDDDGDGVPNYIEKGPDLNNPVDTDGDGVADYMDLDSDGDGILDTTERGAGASARDTDTDGTADYLDLDSDADGIYDAYEAKPGQALDEQGRVAGEVDAANGIPLAVETAAGSGTLNYVIHDQDGNGTPDYRASDSDADGVSDLLERGSSGLPVDTDGDEAPDYLDLDSDGDSITDAVESNNTGAVVDTDLDGTPDRIDLDSDGDAIPDNVETTSDFDDDDVGNWRDLDSDEDGISDALEGTLDPDEDGHANYLDLDSDDDTIPDAVEQGAQASLLDTDGDTHPDYLDLDSDDDGIDDTQEAGPDGAHPRDTDQDGTPDYLDTDSDGDGIPDAVEKGDDVTLADTDSDGTPDCRDLDSDADTVADAIEAGAEPGTPRDTDADAVPDFRDLDSDADGISDQSERGGNATPVDTDDDGKADLVDTDSDDDLVLDVNEGTTDPDRDNVGNWRDNDSDGDLIPDRVETQADFDEDGTPNYLDLDSDADGIRDVLEAGADPSHPRDTDGDDAVDYLDMDSDNDCLADGEESAQAMLVSTSPNANASLNCSAGEDTFCDREHGLCTHGCLLDSDCGAASSGLVCDDSVHGCVPGCRGSDGNKCSGTDVCSSTNGSAGKCQTDSDGDGIPDTVEAAAGLNPNSTDSDGDGIPDSIEAPDGKLVDTDHDGIPDVLDSDADGDGVADKLEIGPDPLHPIDTDGDGIPDYLDTDADGDGWPDSVEKGVDTDKDGTPDCRDLDSDGDGVKDSDELAWRANRVKADSDGDGIDDGAETRGGKVAVDTDGDGTPDVIDTDSDNDGVPDSVERGDGKTPADTDGDGIPDYLDTDTDGDGISDELEASRPGQKVADTDGDGIPDTLDTDSDGDGISDKDESAADPDGDGIGNWRDLDADNDCVLDVAEADAKTQLDPGKPSARASDNCPAEAPICESKTGSCIVAERSECTAATAAKVCASGECDLETGRCIPLGCTSDAACGSGKYCDGNTMSCVTRVGSGQTLPGDALHASTCTAAMAAAVCESGVCNTYTNKCASKDGDSCSAASDCASNACLNGVCVSAKSTPTVNRLSGGCSTLAGARADGSWAFYGVCFGIGLWLRGRRRSGGPRA